MLAGGLLGTAQLGDGLERVIAGARGSRLVDVDGGEYIDYILGAGPLILGHAHPAVIEAIRLQASRGTTYYLLNEPAIELAEAILEVFPSESRLRFCSSGSEATFYAMRLARAVTGRSMIVKFAGAYHGHNDYAMFEAFSRRWTTSQKPEPASAGIPAEVAGTVSVLPFNDVESLRGLFDERGSEIAAVIVEPYQRVIEPIDGFLQALRSTTTAHGSLLIADEVVTGFRFHYGLAQSLFGIEADITAIGKIIGGGLPVAAVAGDPAIMGLADHDKFGDPSYTYISGTLNGNALGAAAGLAALRELRKPGSYEQLNESGQQLRSGLQTRLARQGFRSTVLGRGPMFHAVFSPEAPRTADDLAKSDSKLTKHLYRSLIRHGVMMNPSQRAYVSLAHSQKDIEATCAAFDLAVEDLSRETVD